MTAVAPPTTSRITANRASASRTSVTRRSPPASGIASMSSRCQPGCKQTDKIEKRVGAVQEIAVSDKLHATGYLTYDGAISFPENKKRVSCNVRDCFRGDKQM